MRGEAALEDAELDFQPEHASPTLATQPRVLVTHVPLHRPDRADCGPLRGRRALVQGYGTSYQNFMPKKTSQHLLRASLPMAVFRQHTVLAYLHQRRGPLLTCLYTCSFRSGDDHDFCEYHHPAQPELRLDPGPVEYTFCTFSWYVCVHLLFQLLLSRALSHVAPRLQGERKPCFGMVSVFNDNLHPPELAVARCVLPNQISVYYGYAWLALFSALFGVWRSGVVCGPGCVSVPKVAGWVGLGWGLLAHPRSGCDGDTQVAAVGTSRQAHVWWPPPSPSTATSHASTPWPSGVHPGPVCSSPNWLWSRRLCSSRRHGLIRHVESEAVLYACVL